MAFKRSGVRFPSPPYRQKIRLDCVSQLGQRLTRGSKRVGRFCKRQDFAGIAQLVEHNLAKVGVAGSSPVSRSVEYETELGG